MKCALLATHTVEGTLTAGFYCPARVRRSYLIEIGNPSKGTMLIPHPISCKPRVVSEDMGVKRGVYTAASHVPEANLDMFFISALNTTAGRECIETDFVFLTSPVLFACYRRDKMIHSPVPQFSSR